MAKLQVCKDPKEAQQCLCANMSKQKKWDEHPVCSVFLSVRPQYFKWWGRGESKGETKHMTQILKHFVADFGSWKHHYNVYAMHRGKIKWSEENERK